MMLTGFPIFPVFKCNKKKDQQSFAIHYPKPLSIWIIHRLLVVSAQQQPADTVTNDNEDGKSWKATKTATKNICVAH